MGNYIRPVLLASVFAAHSPLGWSADGSGAVVAFGGMNGIGITSGPSAVGVGNTIGVGAATGGGSVVGLGGTSGVGATTGSTAVGTTTGVGGATGGGRTALGVGGPATGLNAAGIQNPSGLGISPGWRRVAPGRYRFR